MNYCKYCMEPLTKVCTCKENPQSLSHHLLPYTLLDNKYIVGNVLGEGGFGITYIGRDITLDMRVAIKEYYPMGIVNRNHTQSTIVATNAGVPKAIFERGKDCFLQEARILAKFANRPGIVGVLSFFTSNNTAYIIMEYVSGINLRDRLQHGTMSVQQVINLFGPIVQALTLVHSEGLIHRDISPDNIMYMPDNTLKLLDFGAAREVSDQKSLSVMLKHGYAPEEQYRTRGEQGTWTDVYALCATIYRCLTNITPDDAMERLINDELKPPAALGAEISETQEAALLKGLAVQKKDRIQTVGEFWGVFTNMQTLDNPKEEPAPSSPDEAPKKLKKTTKSLGKKILMYSGISISVLLVAFILLLILAARPTPSIPTTPSTPTELITQTSALNDELRLLDPSIRRLTINHGHYIDHESIEIISQLGSGLWQLTINGDAQAPSDFANFSQLAALQNLTDLRINNFPMTDFSFVTNLPHLNRIEITHSGLTDISFMSGLRLTHVDISDNAVTCLTGLEDSADTLTTLIANNNHIVVLDPLHRHIRISRIELNNNMLECIYGLESTMLLRRVEFSDNSIQYIYVLAASSNTLQYLILNNNFIRVLPAFMNVSELRTFTASGNAMRCMYGLRYAVNLRYLNVSDNLLTGVSALSQMTQLRHINISNNRIWEIDALAGLNHTYRTHLYMHNNNISDISHLPDLNYWRITLDGNPIRDFSRMDALSFTNIYFSYHPEIDLRPLGGRQRRSGSEFHIEGAPRVREIAIGMELFETDAASLLLRRTHFYTADELQAKRE